MCFFTILKNTNVALSSCGRFALITRLDNNWEWSLITTVICGSGVILQSGQRGLISGSTGQVLKPCNVIYYFRFFFFPIWNWFILRCSGIQGWVNITYEMVHYDKISTAGALLKEHWPPKRQDRFSSLQEVTCKLLNRRGAGIFLFVPALPLFPFLKAVHLMNNL